MRGESKRVDVNLLAFDKRRRALNRELKERGVVLHGLLKSLPVLLPVGVLSGRQALLILVGHALFSLLATADDARFPSTLIQSVNDLSSAALSKHVYD